jgi:hypothetical protein
MKIGVSLNEVLRDFVGQLAYVYEKYIGDVDFTEGDITSLNLIEHFKFNSIDELNKFLYTEAALEIFGHAGQLGENTMNQFNMFLMDIEDDEEHEVEIVSREINKSIPATYFFLSKLSCKSTNIRFVKDYEKMWDGLDVLITANPQVLESKPEGKISVKINSYYNKDVKSDYSLDDILPFFKNEDLRNDILNVKEINNNNNK